MNLRKDREHILGKVISILLEVFYTIFQVDMKPKTEVLMHLVSLIVPALGMKVLPT